MKIFLLSILLFSSVNAQETSQLFAKFIPEQYRKSPNSLTTVNTILNYIPEINTDLFFYFLEVLKIDASNNSTIMFQRFIKYLNYEKYKSDSLYNNWKAKQIEIINQSNLEEDIKRKARSHFTIDKSQYGKVAPTDLYPIRADSNKISYFKMIYYLGSNDTDYDSTINYRRKVKIYENTILEEFRIAQNMLGEGEDSHSFSISLFDKMERYWKLFSVDDSLNEIVIDYYRNKYSLKKDFSHFELSFFYNKNSLPVFTYSGTTGTPLIITLNERISANQIGLSFGYRFQLKQQKSDFSTLNVHVSYASGKVNISRKLDDLNNGFSQIDNDIKTSEKYTVKFLNSKFEVKSLNYIDIGVSVPIYYLFPDILITFGSSAYFASIDYELEYNYEATTTLISEDIKNKTIISTATFQHTGSYTSNSNSNSFGVNPFLLIEYLITENINVGASLSLQYNSILLKMNL